MYVREVLGRRPNSIAFNGKEHDWKLVREQSAARGKGRVEYGRTLDLSYLARAKFGEGQLALHAIEEVLFEGYSRRHLNPVERAEAWKNWTDNADSTGLLEVVEHNICNLVTVEAIYLGLLQEDLSHLRNPDDEIPF